VGHKRPGPILIYSENSVAGVIVNKHSIILLFVLGKVCIVDKQIAGFYLLPI